MAMTRPEPIVAGNGHVQHVGVRVDVGEYSPMWRWLPICGEQAKRWWRGRRERPWCSRCLWKQAKINEATGTYNHEDLSLWPASLIAALLGRLGDLVVLTSDEVEAADLRITVTRNHDDDTYILHRELINDGE
jgi:hypothetical protein